MEHVENEVFDLPRVRLAWSNDLVLLCVEIRHLLVREVIRSDVLSCLLLDIDQPLKVVYSKQVIRNVRVLRLWVDLRQIYLGVLENCRARVLEVLLDFSGAQWSLALWLYRTLSNNSYFLADLRPQHAVYDLKTVRAGESDHFWVCGEDEWVVNTDNVEVCAALDALFHRFQGLQKAPVPVRRCLELVSVRVQKELAVVGNNRVFWLEGEMHLLLWIAEILFPLQEVNRLSRRSAEHNDELRAPEIAQFVKQYLEKTRFLIP